MAVIVKKIIQKGCNKLPTTMGSVISQIKTSIRHATVPRSSNKRGNNSSAGKPVIIYIIQRQVLRTSPVSRIQHSPHRLPQYLR